MIQQYKALSYVFFFGGLPNLRLHAFKDDLACDGASNKFGHVTDAVGISYRIHHMFMIWPTTTATGQYCVWTHLLFIQHESPNSIVHFGCYLFSFIGHWNSIWKNPSNNSFDVNMAQIDRSWVLCWIDQDFGSAIKTSLLQVHCVFSLGRVRFSSHRIAPALHSYERFHPTGWEVRLFATTPSRRHVAGLVDTRFHERAQRKEIHLPPIPNGTDHDQVLLITTSLPAVHATRSAAPLVLPFHA